MESFEYNGLWWFPDKPDNQVSGVLRLDSGYGANLELIGSFVPGFGKQVDYAPIIHGFTTNATKITLWQCQAIRNFSSVKQGNSFTSSTFAPLYLFIGHHFASSEDMVFESLSINYSNLEDWSGINPFEVDYGGLPAKVAVSYERPIEISAEVNNVSISFHHILKTLNQSVSEVSLNQIAILSVRPHTPLHFDILMKDIVYDLRNFLSLAIGQAIYPQIIAGSVPEVDNEVKIFYASGQPAKSSGIQHPRNMLFSLSDISNNFEQILKTWFEKSKALDPVFELYFGILYNSSMYPKVEFLLLAQALEAYHRRIHKGFYLPKKEYTAVAKALKAVMPDELKSELKKNLDSRIDMGNEYTLITRLKLILNEVLKPYRAQLDQLIGDIDVFAGTVKATRNYLTHHDKVKGAITDSTEIYVYAQKMKVVLQMCFLVELGFSPEQISKMISQSRTYQNLIMHT